MNRRIIIKIFLSITVTAILAIAAWLYRTQLPGALPALLPAAQDIATLIPPANTTSPNRPDSPNTTNLPLKVPKEFNIGIFAKNLNNPRVLALDPIGRLVVSEPDAGQVVLLEDSDKDGAADKHIILLKGLNKPHGLAFDCPQNTDDFKQFQVHCSLFVAEVNQVSVFDYQNSPPSASNQRKILDLPNGGNHTSRTIRIFETPIGKKLFVTVGSSCNVCVETDPRRAAMYSANLDGTDFRPYATGLRNTVFFVQHPDSKKIWGTDMGRDLLGDNTPPDEINILEQDQDYGWPYCYGKNIYDDKFVKQYFENPCASRTPSYIDIPPHSAPLGLAFVPDDGPGGWPQEWKNQLLISYHGSWNRSIPTGYKIVRYILDSAGSITGTEDFLTGFLQGPNPKQALGRPVDLLALPGGTLFVSDDKAGVIYSLTVHNTK